MSKVYRISAESDGKALANADGSVNIVSYVGRELLAELKDVESDVTFSLAELHAISDNETRVIARLTADAQTVGYVLRAKLAAERKANRADGASVENEAGVEAVEPVTA
jgi:hypothetical protein